MAEKGEVPASNSDEDDAWRQIVENYGEAPSFEDLQVRGSGVDPEPLPHTSDPAHPDASATVSEPEPEPNWFHLDEEPAGGYVPEIEPIPRPTPIVFLAWSGVLGAPVVMMVLLLTSVAAPAWLGWGLVAAFLGGFGYLVAHMPKQREDPWDDGARI